ncbi:MAG TPA: sensor domain-containing diguanylate cyclase, partial [Spirochaetota bacterium]|nr:sensor domain-containing diguanylate cyclase [Spirochaetota bacterium]HON16727.1 sensor domain-containing diguanylate cyclase [Spirochaetota bacterium]
FCRKLLNKYMSELKDYILADMSKEELERLVFDFQNLIEIGISLSSNLEFSSLVESILYICIGQMLVDKVAMFLHVNLDNEDLNLYMERGFNINQEWKIPEKSAMLQYFYKKSDIIVGDIIEELMGEDEETAELFSILKPEIVIPLFSKNALNGLIFMSRKIMETPYTAKDILFLEKLSKFASIAVENSRLYRMATIDRMTGLFIHHYFKERLAEELKRAERNKKDLTLLMLDIDHFKRVNDTYGHLNGDTVLKIIASIIHQNIRVFDMASRYGGEEFAVILTDTDEELGLKIAERLRAKVEEADFDLNGTKIKVTISIGVAQFNPEVDDSADSIIARADMALYQAKNTGRNRVCCNSKDCRSK